MMSLILMQWERQWKPNNPDYVPETVPELFNQNKVNDFVWDQNLNKESAEPLASRLNEKHLLAKGTKVTFYRYRNAESVPFFNEDTDVVHCKDVEGVILRIGVHKYDPNG